MWLLKRWERYEETECSAYFGVSYLMLAGFADIENANVTGSWKLSKDFQKTPRKTGRRWEGWYECRQSWKQCIKSEGEVKGTRVTQEVRHPGPWSICWRKLQTVSRANHTKATGLPTENYRDKNTELLDLTSRQHMPQGPDTDLHDIIFAAWVKFDLCPISKPLPSFLWEGRSLLCHCNSEIRRFLLGIAGIHS